jgi:hypothetical protein
MVSKLSRDKTQAGQKVQAKYNPCITCRRPCGMSGICMRPWPKSQAIILKGVSSDAKDVEKNS